MSQDFKWEEKVWGKTRCLTKSDFYSSHELQVKAGGFCSFHYHRHRANRFHVIKGSIAVVAVIGDIRHGQCDRKILTEDMIFDVSSLVAHQFQVLQDGLVIEEYRPDRDNLPIEDSDIIRFCQGGFHVDIELLADKYPVLGF